MSDPYAPSEARIRARNALTRGKTKKTRPEDEIPGQMDIWDVLAGTENEQGETR